MGMNIKNDEAQKLTRELSKLTGESMTAAITEAVRERLERVKTERSQGLVARLLEIGRDSAKRLKEPYRTQDHAELLYDDKGLPR